MLGNKWIKIIAVLVLLGAVIGAYFSPGPAYYEVPEARGTAALCYFSEGTKLVCVSGGEVEMQSGSTLDLQVGSTTICGAGGVVWDTGTFTTTLEALGDLVAHTAHVTGSAEFSSTVRMMPSTDVVPLTIVQAAGMAMANLFEIYTSAGVVQFSVSPGGNTYAYGDATARGALYGNSATITTSQVIYGVDSLYALGYASDARAIVCGTTDITGTKTVSSGADTYEYCTCSMGEAPSTGAGDGYIAWCAISGGDLVLYVVQDDGTAATETNVAVNWCVVSDTEP
jgi:hypothetical protein